jgi:hypothetical protein
MADMQPEPQRGKTSGNARRSSARRNFLKLIGLGGVAGAAAVATGGPPSPAQAEAAGAGYRETPHVKQYYDTAKF